MSDIKVDIVRCIRCKRRLHGLKAKALGIGPICMKKLKGVELQIMAEREGQMRLPETVPMPEVKEDPTWQK